MQKGTATVYLILGLVIIGVLGFVFVFFKPAAGPLKNPTAVNKTPSYKNDSLKLEFQYQDLKVLEDSEAEFNKRGNGDFRKNFKGYVGYEPGKALGAVVVLDKDQKFDTNPLTVWVFDNPSNLSIDAWYKNYWYYPFVWGDFTYLGKFTLAPKEEATISGQIGKSGKIDYQPGKPKFIYVSKDKKMYLFRIIGEAGMKILSAFKFL